MPKSYKSFLASFFVLTFALLFTGCAKSEKLSTQNRQFEEMTYNLFCQEIAGNTISLHYTLQNPEAYGIESVVPTFGTISADHTESGMALENTLAAVKRFDDTTLSEDNQLTKAVLKEYLEDSLHGLQYTLYQEPLSTVNGVQSQIPVLLSEFRMESKEDVEMYLELMDTLPAYFQSVIAFEKEKAEAGLFMSDAVAKQVIAQCQAFLDMGNSNYLISTFVDKVKNMEELDGGARDIYIEENAKAVTETMTGAYKNLKHSMEALMGKGGNNAGLCYFPEGQQYYSYLATRQTGSDHTILELKAMTKAQILDDLTAMEGELGLETAVQISESNAISMLNDLQEKSGNAFPQSPDSNAQIKYVPESMESVLSPAFYMIPPIDNISENVIYINQSQVQNQLSLYTTLAHEGYPGHLYQTTYFASQDPDEIRSILDYGGYTEGWATYAEMMSYYLAPITDTQAMLCQKNASIILGLYALADIGIHYDGWQREDALKFFMAYGIGDENVVSEIYDLILGDPGNYLKYYIGYLEILSIKKDAMQRLGKTFSQKAFHEVVLRTGPAPFEIVRGQVDQWIISGQE
ncbi:MAG: DUF885 domain-containing protein [Hespellia sp.]|nr:DUF885 domain-containing protein [Hespellia sp.]